MSLVLSTDTWIEHKRLDFCLTSLQIAEQLYEEAFKSIQAFNVSTHRAFIASLCRKLTEPKTIPQTITRKWYHRIIYRWSILRWRSTT